MLKELKAWLKRPGNTHAKLAYLLNYSSGATISNWISRKSIPVYVQPRLKKILKRK